MFPGSLVALAAVANASEPTTSAPVPTYFPKPAPWFDESTAYACSYARLVKKDPVWRVNISFPFRGPASLALQSTESFGSKTDTQLFDLPPEGAVVSMPGGTSFAVDTPYYFGIGAIEYRFVLEPATLAAMQKALDDKEALGVAMPEVSKEPFDLELDSQTWAKIQACQSSIGARLMEARPEGEDPGTSDRPPVLRPEGMAGLRRIRYPSRALRNAEEGRVEAQLSIDQFGLPDDCRVLTSSGFANLDASTCRALERYLKFYPALDSEGRATSGYVKQAISWRIPD